MKIEYYEYERCHQLRLTIAGEVQIFEGLSKKSTVKMAIDELNTMQSDITTIIERLSNG